MIAGSDGLFDNLFDEQVIDLLRPFIRGRDELLDPTLCAELIAQEAFTYSKNPHWVSPFAKSAYDHFKDY